MWLLHAVCTVLMSCAHGWTMNPAAFLLIILKSNPEGEQGVHTRDRRQVNNSFHIWDV